MSSKASMVDALSYAFQCRHVRAHIECEWVSELGLAKRYEPIYDCERMTLAEAIENSAAAKAKPVIDKTWRAFYCEVDETW